MLSKAMVKQLNEHVNQEFYASNLYLQMSAWTDLKGSRGARPFCGPTRRKRWGTCTSSSTPAARPGQGRACFTTWNLNRYGAFLGEIDLLSW